MLPWVFWPASLVILAFIAVTMAAPQAMETGIGAVQQAIIRNFSWWYVLVALLFVVFCLYVGFSKMGDVKLGRPDHDPEFSNLAWFALLFAAGMGIGLVFYGMTEPLSHFANPRPALEAAAPSVGVRSEQALSLTYLHLSLIHI